MNMMNPRGKDVVLLIQSSKGCVKAEMESNDYIVMRSLRHKSADYWWAMWIHQEHQKTGTITGKFC